MVTTLQGIMRNGRIKLLDDPGDIAEETHVLITVLRPEQNESSLAHLPPHQVVDLHYRLAAFAEDWSQPGMDVYDDYDANKWNLQRNLSTKNPSPRLQSWGEQRTSRIAETMIQ